MWRCSIWLGFLGFHSWRRVGLGGSVGIIILTHSLFIILTYAHLYILLVWTYSVLFVHCVMLLVTWWLCNQCQKACQMQWMTPYLIVLIHCIQASSYLLIHNLIVLIHCIQCVLGAAAHRLWALCSESHTYSCFWVSISCHQASGLFWPPLAFLDHFWALLAIF